MISTTAIKNTKLVLQALGIFLALAMHNSSAEEYVIVVSGLGGDPEFQEAFDEQAQKIYDAALSLGLNDSQAKLLTGETATKDLSLIHI